MIIKFTVTLSDATVAAFAREGATSGQEIKTLLVEALQDVITGVQHSVVIDDADEDDDDDDPDDVEDTP